MPVFHRLPWYFALLAGRRPVSQDYGPHHPLPPNPCFARLCKDPRDMRDLADRGLRETRGSVLQTETRSKTAPPVSAVKNPFPRPDALASIRRGPVSQAGSFKHRPASSLRSAGMASIWSGRLTRQVRGAAHPTARSVADVDWIIIRWSVAGSGGRCFRTNSRQSDRSGLLVPVGGQVG